MATWARRPLMRAALKWASQSKPPSSSRSFRASHPRASPQYRPVYGSSRPGIFYRWVTSPSFYYQISGAGAVAGGVYIYNLEEVPVSGRRRFNIVTNETVMATADQAYQQTLQQFRGSILPDSHPATRMVARVMRRLIPHVRVPADAPPTEWKVHVVAADEPNAFVLPGGKVFVMTGILPVCAGEDGLAAVLGHEIAHNVAGHVAEKMSQSFLYTGLAVLVQFGTAMLGLPYAPGLTSSAIDLGLAKPNSRTQESEADYIGLLIMSEACYDPHAAVAMWDRMDKMERSRGQQSMAFMSTHPASHDRMTAIEGWMPKAEAKRNEAGCGPLAAYSDSFTNAFRGLSVAG